MTSPLKALLEKEAGWEEFQMIIPHPFLPPRYRELSKNRNMVLLLDRDMTLHIRWEGSRLHEHHPLTPRAAQRLVREALDRMSKYRRELQVFSRFCGQNAEQPFEDLRALDPLRLKEREMPSAQLEEEEEDEIVEIGCEVEIAEAMEAERLLVGRMGGGRMGGENPMGGDFE